MFESTRNNIFGYGSGNPNYGNGSNGGDEPKENVRHFAKLLFELSKYDPDLKAILDNSKLSVNQNQNTGFGVNPYDMSNGEIKSNSFANSNIEGSGENFNPNEDKQINTEDIDNINENNIAEVTANSIYNLLTSQYTITVDVLKLPEYLRLIVNQLTNSNSLNNQNEIGTANTNYSATALSSQNNMQSNNATDNQNNAQLVALNPDQFQELIYYFIINAVAKDKGTSVLSNQNQDNQYKNVATNQVIYPNYQETSSLSVNKNTNKTYGSILQEMRTNFYNKNNDYAYRAYNNYRNGINENGKLKQIIKNESDQQEISINFWGPFLWDVLKRASFSYSLYKAIRNNHRKDKIDAVLGLPHVLFILSLIFGWGAIASTILGLAVLASLVYKAINQYQQTRPKYLLYSLLGTKTFYDIANRLEYALVPEVGNLYKFYKQNADQVSKILHNKYNNVSTPMQYQPGQNPYPNLQQNQIQ